MIHFDSFDKYDDAIDRLLDQIRGNRFFDRLFYLASALGEFSVIWYFAAITTIFWADNGQDQAIRLATALLIESIFINGLVKSLFKRTRPVHDGPRPHRLRTPRTSSFPSGHSTSSFMSATLLSSAEPMTMALWFVLAAVIATSRVYVRIHHASDVVGGSFIGLGIGLAIVALWPIG